MKSERMEMGTCEHAQDAWVKGKNTIYCCPKPHAAIHRRMLEIKGFKKV